MIQVLKTDQSLDQKLFASDATRGRDNLSLCYYLLSLPAFGLFGLETNILEWDRFTVRQNLGLGLP